MSTLIKSFFHIEYYIIYHKLIGSNLTFLAVLYIRVWSIGEDRNLIKSCPSSRISTFR